MSEWYRDFAAGIDAGQPTYHECTECETVGLPPRTTCPTCGHPEMTDRVLSDTAQVVSFTEIQATIPRFSGQTPYTVVIAEFDEGVRLTGQLRGEDVERGAVVRPGVENLDDDEPLITFQPV